LIGVHLAIVWRQKHTQFPGPGRLETNVEGLRFWPTYALKSVGLFLGVAAVLAALGGLAQINPVWLYGPFRPETVSSPAQPDWFLGWLEGALRIFPAWELRIGSYVIPNPFFPAVLLPGLTFAGLFAWPAVDKRFTRDKAPHHLLDRPRDRPGRTALGVGVLTFYVVLFLAGSNDLIAKWFTMPVQTVTWIMRVLVIAAPIAAGFITLWLVGALARSGAERFTKVPLYYFLHRRAARSMP
jgi:ubiquinol-cytochrome c reductase cytochrome b subunit